MILAALLVALAAAGILGGTLVRAVPGSDPAFVPHANACVHKHLGYVRVLVNGGDCFKSEKPFLIASEEKVDALTTTYVRHNSPSDATTANFADESVSCDSGDQATGGGAYLNIGSPGNTNAGDNVALQASYPRFDSGDVSSGGIANGWRAFARELQNVPGDISPSASPHTPVQGFWGQQPTWSQPNTATSATSSSWTLHVYVICTATVVSAP
jgi:hypothetical protein